MGWQKNSKSRFKKGAIRSSLILESTCTTRIRYQGIVIWIELVYLILSGRVSCRLDRDVSFKTYIEGSYFGDIEVLNQSRRLFSVKADEAVTLAVIDRQVLESIFIQNTDFASIFIQRTLKRYLSCKRSIKKIRFFRKITKNNDWWEENQEEEGQQSHYIMEKISKWVDHVIDKKLKVIPKNDESEFYKDRGSAAKSFALSYHKKIKELKKIELFRDTTSEKLVQLLSRLPKLNDNNNSMNQRFSIDSSILNTLVTTLNSFESKIEQISGKITEATEEHRKLRLKVDNRQNDSLKPYRSSLDDRIKAQNDGLGLGNLSIISPQPVNSKQLDNLRSGSNQIENPDRQYQKNNKINGGYISNIESESYIMSPNQSPDLQEFKRAVLNRIELFVSPRKLNNSDNPTPRRQRFSLDDNMLDINSKISHNIDLNLSISKNENKNRSKLNLSSSKPRSSELEVAEEWSMISVDQDKKMDQSEKHIMRINKNNEEMSNTRNGLDIQNRNRIKEDAMGKNLINQQQPLNSVKKKKPLVFDELVQQYIQTPKLMSKEYIKPFEVSERQRLIQD